MINLSVSDSLYIVSFVTDERTITTTNLVMRIIFLHSDDIDISS